MYGQVAVNDRIHKMYNRIWAQTGQIQDKLPLFILEEPTVNAYNDGTKIVIYRGLINSTNSYDEIALVIGHEIAHGNLWHLKMLNDWNKKLTPTEVSVLEAHADKLGAIYMMKAGYDVCKGRKLFKNWLDEKGDYLGGSHPGYAYRYNQLNINCE
jgi:predicted Zn-dependent protease